MPYAEFCRSGPRHCDSCHLERNAYGSLMSRLRFRRVDGDDSGEGATSFICVWRSFNCQMALDGDTSPRRQQSICGLSRHFCRCAFREGLRRCAATIADIRGQNPLARYTFSNFRRRRGSASRFLCTVISFRARRLRSRRHRKPSGSRKG